MGVTKEQVRLEGNGAAIVKEVVKLPLNPSIHPSRHPSMDGIII